MKTDTLPNDALPAAKEEGWGPGAAGFAGGFLIVGAAIALKLGLLSLFGKKALR